MDRHASPTIRHPALAALRRDDIDRLTGLAGRDEINRSLNRTQARPEDVGAVLFIDLDRFKWVNDSLGHQVGDRVLEIVARRLERQVRPSDIPARFGGDEFVVVMAAIDSVGETTKVAKRIIEALSQTMRVGDRQIAVGASVGIAISSSDGSTQDLLRQADTALYEAKRRGRGRHVIFDHRLAARTERRNHIESCIRNAELNRQLTVHYQPIVDLSTYKVVAYEALARLTDEQLGSIPPSEFIPLASEIGQIGRLGRHLRRIVTTDLAAAATHDPTITFAVNLAPAELEHPNLVDEITTDCDHAGIPPSSLIFELSEDLLIRDHRRTQRTIHEIRQLGARISLDDFGTGQAALTSLRDLHVDQIKIDRSFVSGLEHQTLDHATCQAVKLLADAIGATVVAEGIETPTEATLLTEMGIDYGQGYLFAKPAPVIWSTPQTPISPPNP